MANYFTGDTIRPQVTFRDWAPEGELGNLVNPTSVTVTLYNADQQVIGTGVGTNDSIGVYHYDWVLPDEPGKYFIEFKGMLNSEPTVIRQDYHVKFKA